MPGRHHLHFVLSLVETPYLRQEMNMWMDEPYWIENWMRVNGNGYIPATHFPLWLNISDTGPELAFTLP
ncbi:hypothetical protein Y032_0009g508 [Ancylostoma ceylanicum]|uniref:Uncharacterized protein n=1 Tax=Ancylostoma ceylanicum TaxID=53326 RepID=A0A016VII7_9BILA|nr:hypothetical protein Y032_0009g508 [Ancylostoma ceylanicum]